MRSKNIDTFFLGIVITLTVIGVFVFVSALLGILTQDRSQFYRILFNQIVLGLGFGSLALFICSKIHYTFWRKYAFYFFFLSVLLTLSVFIPNIGFEHGGALRWISIGPLSFQPVEFLKLSFIIYFASWLSWVRFRVNYFKFGILPLFVLLGIIAVILVLQPDTKNLLLLIIVGLLMFLASGVSWKHILGLGIVAIILIVVLVSFKPYLLSRIQTFIDPTHDPTGSSYQIQQSLIAIGSGGVFGRGFGQSIQKFDYLPEPQGDSIFAVIGEELGFMGSIIIILLYVALALRGLRIAHRTPNSFGRLLVSGIVILIVAQSFLNIASAIGVLPLTGVQLVFISHGGTSLFVFLAAIGIILNVSRYQKVKRLKL